jgi:hypothetical protein
MKFMLTVMWGIDGFHVVGQMTTQKKFDYPYFVANVLTPLVQKIFPERRRAHAIRLYCHLDNSRVHFSKVSEKFFFEHQIVHVPHPPYSPDLSPSDFWLFGHMKAGLAGQSFAEPEEILEGRVAFLEEVQISELRLVFHDRVERIRWVLDHNGDYYNE